MANPRAAVELVKGSALLHIQCRVKPGASKVREGVAAVRDDAVEVCVAAPPRDGASNKAVVQVMSEALGVPKSDVQIVRGLKSREKTIAVGGGGGVGAAGGAEWVAAARAKLEAQAREE